MNISSQSEEAIRSRWQAEDAACENAQIEQSMHDDEQAQLHDELTEARHMIAIQGAEIAQLKRERAGYSESALKAHLEIKRMYAEICRSNREIWSARLSIAEATK